MVLSELNKDKMYSFIRDEYKTTKQEVLDSLERRIKRMKEEAENNKKIHANFYALYIALTELFKERVTEAIIFDTLPDGWLYRYLLEYDLFSLNICHVKELNFNDKGEFSSRVDDAEYSIIQIKPRTFTVDEYAKFYEVEQGTVRQWIRRGKIRTAKKIGGEWKIPELTIPPTRGYTSAQYVWDSELAELPDEYAYLNDYHLATFYQDREDKKVFHVLLAHKDTIKGIYSNNKDITMDAKEREKMELMMITHPQIKYSGFNA